MTEQEAKEIIRDGHPQGNIVRQMEAIAKAKEVLGQSCSMKEIWKWAEGGDVQVKK